MSEQDFKKENIINLAKSFCSEHLDDECEMLTANLIQCFFEKYPGFLSTAAPKVWASAFVYTICSINLLFSKKSRIHVSTTDIFTFFEVSKSVVLKKSRMIKKMMNIDPVFGKDYLLKENAERNRFNLFDIIRNLFS